MNIIVLFRYYSLRSGFFWSSFGIQLGSVKGPFRGPRVCLGICWDVHCGGRRVRRGLSGAESVWDSAEGVHGMISVGGGKDIKGRISKE